MNKVNHECDFCSDPVAADDDQAMVYLANSFSSVRFGFTSRGAWLACGICAAYIRQYDAGQDGRAKSNLASRSFHKYRRNSNLRGMPTEQVNQILRLEIVKLHNAFWGYRTDDPPVPYALKRVEG